MEDNKINKDEDLYIYMPILLDEEKTLRLIEQELGGRVIHEIGVAGPIVVVPQSFEGIPPRVFEEMKQIDELYQKSKISRNNAIKMMAELLRSSAYWDARFKQYIDSLIIQKLKELYELIEIAREDLLYAINSGRITMNEFNERYKLLTQKEFEALSSINETIERLDKGRERGGLGR